MSFFTPSNQAAFEAIVRENTELLSHTPATKEAADKKAAELSSIEERRERLERVAVPRSAHCVRSYFRRDGTYVSSHFRRG